MAGDEDSDAGGEREPQPGGVVEAHGYIPYGYALDYVRKACPDLGEEAAHARLLELWHSKRVKVVSDRSLVHLEDTRQARWLDKNDALLRRSWWCKADLERAIGRGGPARQEVAGVPPPARPKATRTKPTLPVDELKAEMQRRARSGELEPSMQAEARALSAWCNVRHPGRPKSISTIRNHPELKAEYERLRACVTRRLSPGGWRTGTSSRSRPMSGSTRS
jgi:hypothetical protein